MTLVSGRAGAVLVVPVVADSSVTVAVSPRGESGALHPPLFTKGINTPLLVFFGISLLMDESESKECDVARGEKDRADGAILLIRAIVHTNVESICLMIRDRCNGRLSDLLRLHRSTTIVQGISHRYLVPRTCTTVFAEEEMNGPMHRR